MPTLLEVTQQQDAARANLLAAATPARGLAGEFMPPVNGRQVRVMNVNSTEFGRIIGQSADGVVMRVEESYVIFLGNPPHAAPFSLANEETSRYYAWHEYEHITRGDVFHDAPETVYNRFISNEMQNAELDVTLAGARRYIEEARTRGATTEANAIAEHFGL